MRFPQSDSGPGDYLQRCWPVGSVYVSVVDTNPVDLFGFGVWSVFASGRCLFGKDEGQAEFDTLEETGGAKTHTLTAAEMPAHTHVQDPHLHLQNPHNHVENVASLATGGLVGSTPDASTNTSVASGYSTANTTAVNQNATAVNQATGGGAAHNNLPPYITCRFWKRTA